MPSCPSCGATVSGEAAYCGECGTNLSAANEATEAAPDHAGEQIKQRVREEREAESDGWLGPRAKGFFYTIGGVIAIGLGYWIGFVGYTETQMGPQGFGVYQVTYPIGGLIILGFGLLMLLAGLAGLAGMDLSE